jgi:ATP-dependent exoDNAse (exonuclease V) beta subunit
MTEVSHSIIRASAGSGKTYELVRRMVRLLVLGVKPESIAALTFTRKAAGEFFARLLQTLAGFAEKPEGAKAYLEELSKDTRATSLRLLRSVIENMDRLRLGTLDSFFAAMVQSLPFELGLAGAGVIMSDHETAQARAEALDAVLVDLMKPENDAARRELVESWKLATLGSEGNAPARVLEQWFETLHDRYLDCSDEQRWGPSKWIWTEGTEPIWLADEDLLAAKKELEGILDPAVFKHKSVGPKWEAFYAALSQYAPGTPLDDEIEYMLKPERGEPRMLREGRGSWKMWKTADLGGDVSRALYHLLAIIVGKELRIVCERTLGRNRLLRIYEKSHRQLVRGAGRLTFDDLALLLSGRLNPGDAKDWKERWERLRLDMEFRLNARYDHWLFDEFQDTSLRQWRVFENLVEEVLQDPEGQRSFFAVGDLKQSIYLWREAEPELFLGVERRHSAKLKSESLRVSWRSAPQVLAMVNDLFGKRETLEELLPGAMQWWAFEPHEASDATKKLNGHAALLMVGTKEDKDAALVALLEKIQPRERGLSCAVLTRGNEQAKRLAGLLRRELACDVMCESEEAVATDNAVTLLLLSLIQLGAHPQDTFAWHHVRMTPLRAWVEQHRMNAECAGAEVRGEVLRSGFLGVAEIWSKRLHEVFPELDAFSEWRLRQFLEMCARFDESGSRDVDAFLQFAREHRVAAAGATRALQVMTIHKSKGLEFDVVILPDLQVTVLDDARRVRLLTARDDNGDTEWVLDRPPALVLDWDGRLAPEVERMEARAAFEGLCRLYVAMTRAKEGLYLIQQTGSRAFQERSEAGVTCHLLKEQEDGVPYELPTATPVHVFYERGERDWFEQHEMKAELAAPETPKTATAKQPLGELLRAVNQPVQRRTPSGEESFKLKGSDLLTPQRDLSRRLGTRVHELFEAVEWLAEADADIDNALAKLWKARGLDQRQRFDEAAEKVRGALRDAAVREYFIQGTGTREVWRERRFDLLLDKEWISGTLDRVVLERDAKGVCTAATIVDFKTDAAAGPEDARKKAESYAPQMKLYRKAVQRLAGLGVERIGVALVFVNGPWVVDLFTQDA